MAGSSGYKLDQPTVDAIIELISTYISTGQLPGGGGSTPLVGSLTSTSTTSALRADQGPAITTLISTAQSTANSASTAAADAQSTANTAQSTANGKYTKPGSGIPTSDLADITHTVKATSFTLTDSDNEQILELSSALNITIPNNLSAGFSCIIAPRVTGTIAIIPSGVTINFGTTTINRVVASNPLFAIVRKADGTFAVSGV